MMHTKPVLWIRFYIGVAVLGLATPVFGQFAYVANQFSNDVSGYTINASSGAFTLSGLSPLFTGATPPVSTITVMTLSNMDSEGSPSQGQIAVGKTVSVKGLLFNTATNPTLVTRTIEDHQ